MPDVKSMKGMLRKRKRRLNERMPKMIISFRLLVAVLVSAESHWI